MDHHADEIVAGFLVVGAFDPQRLEIGCHLLQDAPAHVVQIANRGQFGIAGPVGPERQQPPVFPRKTEQDCEHARRQFDRDRIDPVEDFASRQGVEQFAGALSDFAFHFGHAGRRELGRNSPALAGMLRAIHGNEHR